MKKNKILLSLLMIIAFTFAVFMYAPTDAYADGDFSIYIYHSYADPDTDNSACMCPLCSKYFYRCNDVFPAGSTHRFYIDAEILSKGYTCKWRCASDQTEYFSLAANENYCDVTFLKCSGKQDPAFGDGYRSRDLYVDVYDSNGTFVGSGYEQVQIAESDYVPAIDISCAWTADTVKSDIGYTGSAITPEITVVDENKKQLTAGTDYTLKYDLFGKGFVDEIKEAGEYNITICPLDTQKYTDSLDLNITVVKPETQTLTGKASYTKSYSTTGFTLNIMTSGDGKLTFKSSNASVATVSGTGKVTMKGIGKTTITVTATATDNYAQAVKKITVTVNPATNKLSSVKNLSGKKMKVTYTKSTKAAGYQIQYSTSPSFKKSVTKTVTVKENAVTSKTISKLKMGKTYYVRVRGYKKVSGKTYYGSWSAKKSVKIRK